jgi:uncharacterized protein
MKRIATALLLLIFTASASALTPPAEKPPPRTPLPAPTEVVMLDWDDFLPDKDLTLAYKDIPLHDYLGESGPAAMQSGSNAVRKELNNRLAKVPGFVVPLSISAEGIIKEAFLVPYFGACIHVPPPPPNQIVYIRSEKGFKIRSVYDPYWITGMLKTESKDSRMGTAAYTLTAQKVERYETE